MSKAEITSYPHNLSKETYDEMFEAWLDASGTELTATIIHNTLGTAFDGYSRDQASVFRNIIEKEIIIRSHLQTRKNAVSGLQWNITGGSDTKNEEVEKILNRAGINTLMNHLLDAVGYGYAGAFIKWGVGGGTILDFPTIDPTNWEFDKDGTPYLIGLDGTRRSVKDFDGNNVIYHQFNAQSGIPSARGLCRTLIWTYFFKLFSFRHKARYLEKYGIPFIMAKLDQKDYADDDIRTTIKSNLRNIGADGVGVFTDKTEVTSINVGAQGTNAEFQPWLKYLDETATLLILGQIASSGPAGGLGSDGQAQDNVRRDIIRSDARGLQETINNQVMRPLEWFKYGTNEMEFTLDAEPPSDLTKKGEQMNSLKGMGYVAKRDWVEKTFGIPLEDEKIESAPVLPTEAPVPPLGGLVETDDNPVDAVAFSDAVDEIITNSTLPQDVKDQLYGKPAKTIIGELRGLALEPSEDLKKKSIADEASKTANLLDAHINVLLKQELQHAVDEASSRIANQPPAEVTVAVVDITDISPEEVEQNREAGLRADGSKKGLGFLGKMERPDGNSSSEISIGIQINGREVEVPTMVPTLTQEEIDYLLNTPTDKLFTADVATWKRIEQKAVDHANQRIEQGKSPFAQEGESPELLTEEAVETPFNEDAFQEYFNKYIKIYPVANHEENMEQYRKVFMEGKDIEKIPFVRRMQYFNGNESYNEAYKRGILDEEMEKTGWQSAPPVLGRGDSFSGWQKRKNEYDYLQELIGKALASDEEFVRIRNMIRAERGDSLIDTGELLPLEKEFYTARQLINRDIPAITANKMADRMHELSKGLSSQDNFKKLNPEKKEEIIKSFQVVIQGLRDKASMQELQPEDLSLLDESWRTLLRHIQSDLPGSVGGFAEMLGGLGEHTIGAGESLAQWGNEIATGAGARRFDADLIQSKESQRDFTKIAGIPIPSANKAAVIATAGGVSIAESILGAYLGTKIANLAGLPEASKGFKAMQFLGWATPAGMQVAGQTFHTSYQDILNSPEFNGWTDDQKYWTAFAESMLASSFEIGSEFISWKWMGGKVSKAFTKQADKLVLDAIKKTWRQKVAQYGKEFFTEGAKGYGAELSEEIIAGFGQDLAADLRNDSKFVNMFKKEGGTEEALTSAIAGIVENAIGVLSSFGVGGGASVLNLNNQDINTFLSDPIKNAKKFGIKDKEIALLTRDALYAFTQGDIEKANASIKKLVENGKESTDGTIALALISNTVNALAQSEQGKRQDTRARTIEYLGQSIDALSDRSIDDLKSDEGVRAGIDALGKNIDDFNSTEEVIAFLEEQQRDTLAEMAKEADVKIPAILQDIKKEVAEHIAKHGGAKKFLFEYEDEAPVDKDGRKTKAKIDNLESANPVITLYVDAISRGDIEGLMKHEAFIHGFIKSVLSDKAYQKLLNDVSNQLSVKERATIEKVYNEKYKNRDNVNELVKEEMLAHYVKSRSLEDQRGFMGKQIAKLIRFIKSTFGVDVSEERMMEVLKDAFGKYTAGEATQPAQSEFTLPEQETSMASVDISEPLGQFSVDGNRKTGDGIWYRIGNDNEYSEFTFTPSNPELKGGQMSGSRGSGYASGMYAFRSPQEGATLIPRPSNPLQIDVDRDSAIQFQHDAISMMRFAEGREEGYAGANKKFLIITLRKFAPIDRMDRETLEQDIDSAIEDWSAHKQVHPMNILLSRWGYDGVEFTGESQEFADNGTYGNVVFPPIDKNGKVLGLKAVSSQKMSPDIKTEATSMASVDIGMKSPLLESVFELQQETFSKDQLKGVLNKLAKEEQDDLGVMEWIDSQEGKIEKSDLIDFIQQGTPVIDVINSFTPQDIKFKPYSLSDGDKYQEIKFTLPTPNRMTDEARLEQINKRIQEISDDPSKNDVTDARDAYREFLNEKMDKYDIVGWRDMIANQAFDLLRTKLTDSEYDKMTQLEEAIETAKVFDPFRMFDAHPRPGLESEHKNLTAEWDMLNEREYKDDPAYKSSHWDEPNVFGHLRTQEFQTADGKTLLLGEELQSDWHQAGRKDGYSDGATYTVQNGQSHLLDKYERKYFNTEEEANQYANELAEIYKDDNVGRFTVIEAKRHASVPNAPFKKSWPMFLFKQLLKEGVDTGADAVGWTTGDIQADRYDLSKQLNKIEVISRINSTTGEQSKSIYLTPISGGNISLGVNNDGIVDNVSGSGAREGHMMAWEGKPLSDVIGKNISEKVMEAKLGTVFEGDNLKTDAPGMKAFYDKILPKAVEKYIKKLDPDAKVNVEKVVVRDNTSVTGEWKKKYGFALEGHPYTTHTKLGDPNIYSVEEKKTGKVWPVDTYEDAQAMIIEKLIEIEGGQEVWYVPITDKIEQEVKKGQPLYSIDIEGEIGDTTVPSVLTATQGKGNASVDIRKMFKEWQELEEPLSGQHSDPSSVEKMRATKKFNNLRKLIEKHGLDFKKTLWTLTNKPSADIVEQAVVEEGDPKETIGYAVKQFGVTDDFNEAFYILPDGRLLDGSGKNKGQESGTRNLDHRDVSVGGTDAMVRFMRQGNIRFYPEARSLNLETRPTEEQNLTIRKYATTHNGELIVEVQDGERTNAFIYDAGTPATKILSDIDKFYNNEPIAKSTTTRMFSVDINDDLEKARKSIDAEEARRYEVEDKLSEVAIFLNKVLFGVAQESAIGRQDVDNAMVDALDDTQPYDNPKTMFDKRVNASIISHGIEGLTGEGSKVFRDALREKYGDDVFDGIRTLVNERTLLNSRLSPAKRKKRINDAVPSLANAKTNAEEIIVMHANKLAGIYGKEAELTDDVNTVLEEKLKRISSDKELTIEERKEQRKEARQQHREQLSKIDQWRKQSVTEENVAFEKRRGEAIKKQRVDIESPEGETETIPQYIEELNRQLEYYKGLGVEENKVVIDWLNKEIEAMSGENVSPDVLLDIEEAPKKVTMNFTTYLADRMKDRKRTEGTAKREERKNIAERLSIIVDYIRTQKLPASVKAKFLTALRNLSRMANNETRDDYLDSVAIEVDEAMKKHETRIARNKLKALVKDINKARLEKLSDELKALATATLDSFSTKSQSIKTKQALRATIDFITKPKANEEVLLKELGLTENEFIAEYGDIETNLKNAVAVKRKAEMPPSVLDQIASLEETSVSDMDIEEIEAITATLKSIFEQNSHMKQLREGQRSRGINEKSIEITDNLEKRTDRETDKILKKMLAGYRAGQLPPEGIAFILDGYRDNGPMFKHVIQPIWDAYNKYYAASQVVEAQLEEFLGSEEMKKARLNKGSIHKTLNQSQTYKLDNGMKVKLTRGQMIALYLHSRNADNMRHLMEGGFVLPNKIANDFPYRLSFNDLSSLLAEMSDAEIALAEKMSEIYDTQLKPLINETSNKINGYSLAEIEKYFPIMTAALHREYIENDYSSLSNLNNMDAFNDYMTQSYGFLNRRKRGAKNPLVLHDAYQTLGRSINDVAKYHGFTEALRDVKALLRKRNSQGKTIEAVVKGKWEDSYWDAISSIPIDIERGTVRKGSFWDKATRNILNNYTRGVLGVNPGVSVLQYVSWATAQNEIPIKYWLAAHAKLPASGETMSEWSSLIGARLKGKMNIAIGESTINKAGNTGMKMIQTVDGWVIGMIWNASEARVRAEQPGLQGEEFYQAVARETERVVHKTQPTFEAIDRAMWARDPNVAAMILMRFSSQTQKNYLINMKNELGFWKHPKTRESWTKYLHHWMLNRIITPTLVGLVRGGRGAVRASVLALVASVYGYTIPPDDDDTSTLMKILGYIGGGNLVSNGQFAAGLANILMGFIPGDIVGQIFGDWKETLRLIVKLSDEIHNDKRDKNNAPKWKKTAGQLSLRAPKVFTPFGLPVKNTLESLLITPALIAKYIPRDTPQWLYEKFVQEKIETGEWTRKEAEANRKAMEPYQTKEEIKASKEELEKKYRSK